MDTEKLKVEFGQPEHGWLHVDMQLGNFKLKFEASDVPINPIDQLISAIREITKGSKAEVWWHLEPAGYYLCFDKLDRIYKLAILFEEADKNSKEIVFQTEGSYQNLIMPFYRAIKKFVSLAYDEPHWPKTEEIEIKKLTDLVKAN